MLIATTAVAVVTDATLIPFYPRLFAEAFGVADPQHVGIYLAATCLIVMLVLPLWARLERRFTTLQLLCVGQLGAGLLALASFSTTQLWMFWLCSLGMIVFKASYLLVYPYVMRIEPKARHADTIGLLAVIVHLGGILGATIGGWVLEHNDPRAAYLVMAAGDFLQMGVSIALVRRGARVPEVTLESESELESGLAPTTTVPTASSTPASTPAKIWGLGPLARLGVIMVVVYFSDYILRPFFVEYWSARTSLGSELIAGWIYAIPALASLLALAAQRVGWSRSWSLSTVLALVLLGVLLQAVPHPAAIIGGRLVFGWAAFRGIVDLDLALFEISPPERYAEDFSRMNLCQQGGALVAFWAAGAAVSAGGLTLPFFVAAGGFFIAMAIFAVFGGRFISAAPAGEVLDAGATVEVGA
nr:MFS transporter [Pseudenhygromyxa sp. WMMC2535]